MDCTPPGSSVHGIFQARILEWVAISLLQEIFLTQGSNLDLLHCTQTVYHLSHQGSPNEYSKLISFSIDWLDFLAGQGTLKSLFQHHSSKASVLRHSAVFIVQLSHPYMTTGKTKALTRRTFVSKVMSLLFFFFFNINLFILIGG